ncbi:TNF receptor-associated factor family protein [Carex littledalei]|uniref:TNF receptor-associated factor family protein n=1 Tax=Carex littledalei TaxID=544730 RepID=A0A833RGF6_9POAL|nr:TNF receptor-associated factor family protein [Carex littledalei]
MDLPMTDLQPIRNSTLLQYDCPNCDTELVHKVAQLVLTGLATACIDNTAGDPFRSHASVAVTLRKEMVDYLTDRSQNFITESIVGTVEVVPNQQVEFSDDPAEIISDFMDDFAEIKRNLFGRVSGWLLSENREDKIDDFAQDMETDNFWPIDRREGISAIFIKNVDMKRKYHCGEKYQSAEKLREHMSECTYRKVDCTYEGCRAKFSAFSKYEHEAACEFKIVECEQSCGERLLRRDMDRHCITVCKMRMVNCPFYQIGCESAFGQSELAKHCRDVLSSHVLYVLKVVHKKETLSEDELETRRNMLKESDSWDDLSEAKDVRSLTWAVKNLETKLKRPEN